MGKIRSASLMLGLLALATAATVAQAQWLPDGALVTVADNNQQNPQIVTDGRDGVLIIWEDGRGADGDLYMQRLDMLGFRQWGAGDVAVCAAIDVQENPSLVSDGAGGAFAAWEDDRSVSYHSYAQHMDGDGLPVWPVDGVWVDTGSTWPRMAPDGVGGAFISWQEASTFPNSIAVQRLDNTGGKMWPGAYTVIGTGLYPHITADGTGGALVGWQRLQGPSYGNWVLGMRMDADGGEVWPDSTISPSYWCYFDSDVASDGAGGGIWAYTESGDVIAQRRDAAGAFPWGAGGITVLSGLTGAQGVQLVSDGAGGAVVMAGSFDAIHVNRILADGSLPWGTTGTVVCDDPAGQESPQLASDGHGGAYVAWQDERNVATATDIYAQHVDTGGDVQWADDGVPICTAAEDQTGVRITATGTSSAVITWHDLRNSSTTWWDIYAQAVHYDGSIGDPPFEVVATDPATNALDQPADVVIEVDFSADVDPATLLAANLLVHGSISGAHTGALVPYGSSGMGFDPAVDFDHGEKVTVVLTDGFAATGAVSLTPYCFEFTIEAEGVAGGFLDGVKHAVGTRPYGVCAADLHGDGRIDLMVANYDDDTIAVLAGYGNGDFVRQTDLTTADQPRDVKAADVDGDGDMDLIAVEYGNNSVRVFRNAGSGVFSIYTSHFTGNGPEAVCVGDFDNDGHLDLATADLIDDAISVFLATGTGSFGLATAYAAGDNPTYIACGDVNGDRYLDLFTANLLSDGVSMFINDGDGTFRPSVELTAGDGPQYVHLADLNGDGHLDLVISAGQANEMLVRLFNPGNNTFYFPVAYTTRPVPRAGAPADVDGDGHLDLIYTGGDSETISVRLNNGSGVFGAATPYEAGNDPISLTAADVDGDGALDLIASNLYSDDLSVLLNHHSLSGTELPDVPLVTGLKPNVPNPFNPLTRIEYAVKSDGHVRLVVYDARGREVTTLIDDHQAAREHSVYWDGRDASGSRVASGVYFYKLFADNMEETRKMVLVK